MAHPAYNMTCVVEEIDAITVTDIQMWTEKNKSKVNKLRWQYATKLDVFCSLFDTNKEYIDAIVQSSSNALILHKQYHNARLMHFTVLYK